MSDVEKKKAYWLKLAEDNLDTAHILLQHKKYLDAGFFCHQTIEKLLKAYHWHTLQSEPPYIHNVIRLAELTGLFEKMDENRREVLDALMPLNIERRYPDELADHVAQAEAKELESLVRKTGELLVWIKSFMKN
jgi:HEPN domain-containing protein